MKNLKKLLLVAVIVPILGLFAFSNNALAAVSATVNSTNASWDSIVLSGNIAGVTDPADVKFIYGSNPSALSGKATVQISGNTYSVTMSSLAPSTKYYYKFYTISPVLRVMETVKEGEATTTATPKGSVASTVVRDTSVDVRGAVVAVGDTKNVKLIYGATTTRLVLSAPLSFSSSGVFTGTISSLVPSSTYYYALQYSANGKTQVISDIVTVTTKKKATGTTGGGTGTPSNTGASASVAIIDSAKTSVTLKGTVTNVSDTESVHFFYGTAPDKITQEAGMTFSGNSFSVTAAGLTEASIYHYVIVHQDGLGKTTLLSKASTFATLGGAPVANTSTSNIEMNSVTVEGSVFGVDDPQKVKLAYGGAQNNLTFFAPMAFESVSNFSARLSGLSPASTYYYAVQYTNGGSTQNISDVGTVTTARVAGASGTGTGSQTAISPYEGRLVPCEGVDENGNETCGFNQVMELISNVIDFLLTILAPLIAALIMLYAGILILTSGGSAEKVSQAKGMFSKVIIGLVIALGSWVIVKSILIGLGYDSSYFPHFW